MLFNSLSFLIFLPIVFGLYWLPVKKDWWQNTVVGSALLFFYAYWDWLILGLFVGSVAFTVLMARQIMKVAHTYYNDCTIEVSRVWSTTILFAVGAVLGTQVLWLGGFSCSTMHAIYRPMMFGMIGASIAHFKRIVYTQTDAVMRDARVVCLPSNCETPGIAGLEAAALGVRPVVPREGGTTQYYGWDAVYLDPLSETSIASSVEEAWRLGRLSVAQRGKYGDLNWSICAQKTLAAYKCCLQG